jgi:hypothetical protein
MANSEMNSDVLSCSDFKNSFIHEMFNATTQKLNSPSDKIITRSSLPVTKNSIIKCTTYNRKAPVQKVTKTKIFKKNPVKKSNINIQYWSTDGKYIIYLTRMRNGVTRRAFSESFSPFRAESNKFYIKFYINLGIQMIVITIEALLSQAAGVNYLLHYYKKDLGDFLESKNLISFNRPILYLSCNPRCPKKIS